jgi:hypothetical protein
VKLFQSVSAPSVLRPIRVGCGLGAAGSTLGTAETWTADVVAEADLGVDGEVWVLTHPVIRVAVARPSARVWASAVFRMWRISFLFTATLLEPELSR